MTKDELDERNIREQALNEKIKALRLEDSERAYWAMRDAELQGELWGDADVVQSKN